MANDNDPRIEGTVINRANQSRSLSRLGYGRGGRGARWKGRDGVDGGASPG